jgi:hypothetical protein
MNTTQQLTEKEAWLKLAEIYTGTRNVDNRFALQSPTNPDKSFHFGGVCCGILGLGKFNFIDEKTQETMLDKMDDYGDKQSPRVGIYFWPNNSEGDKQRVQFCLDRANEL